MLTHQLLISVNIIGLPELYDLACSI